MYFALTENVCNIVSIINLIMNVFVKPCKSRVYKENSITFKAICVVSIFAYASESYNYFSLINMTSAEGRQILCIFLSLDFHCFSNLHWCSSSSIQETDFSFLFSEHRSASQ